MEKKLRYVTKLSSGEIPVGTILDAPWLKDWSGLATEYKDMLPLVIKLPDTFFCIHQRLSPRTTNGYKISGEVPKITVEPEFHVGKKRYHVTDGVLFEYE